MEDTLLPPVWYPTIQSVKRRHNDPSLRHCLTSASLIEHGCPGPGLKVERSFVSPWVSQPVQPCEGGVDTGSTGVALAGQRHLQSHPSLFGLKPGEIMLALFKVQMKT